jgi:hypothetical protein
MSTKDVSTENCTEQSEPESPVQLPDDWSYRVEQGRDVFEHDETGLRIRIDKQYGKSARHDDFEWHGTIRRGTDGVGEPLTWGGRNDRDELRAVAAKLAAGAPDGDYDPAEHEPESAWEAERPRWPDALGLDDEFADPREWTRGDD